VGFYSLQASHRVNRNSCRFLPGFSVLWAISCLQYAVAASLDTQSVELQFRRDRETWMRSERSPLALAGLFWLKPGANCFGTDSSNDIVLPAGSAPGKVGRLMVSGRRVEILVENSEARVWLGKERIKNRLLKSDADGQKPDLLAMGDLRFRIIQRGKRLALRLINLKSPALLKFNYLDFYPVGPDYRVEGEFVPYHPHKKIRITSVTGEVEEADCPGLVSFSLKGKALTLEPILESPQARELFFIFKDTTNGKETYEGGRFLYADLPRGKHVILNFNRAHNPYCAYSPYSTCPLPPPQNWLKLPVPAGEKKYPLH
jgi:uncharacterized protein